MIPANGGYIVLAVVVLAAAVGGLAWPLVAALNPKPARRLYKSGTAWCAWRWTDVDSQHITRLHVLKTPWWAVCIHWLHAPDPEPFLHDHPVSFLSIILRGGYREMRNGRLWQRRRFNFVRASADDRHRIVAVGPNTVTLCLMGPKIRDWGFHTPGGWVGWKAYYAGQRQQGEAA